MSRSLVVKMEPRGAGLENAACDELGVNSGDVVELGAVASPAGVRAQAGRRRFDLVVLASVDPGHACKFAPLCLWLLACRPRTVAWARKSGGWQRASLTGFLLANLPNLVAQFLGAVLTILIHAILVTALSLRKAPISLPDRVDRVLYIRTASGYLAQVGGSIAHADGVIRGMRDCGTAVMVREAILPGGPPVDPVDGRRWTVPLASRLLSGIAAMGGDLTLMVKSFRDAKSATAIYQRATPCSAAAMLLSAATGTPYILEYNSTPDYSGTQPLLGRYERWIDRINLARASRIVVISEVLRLELVSLGIESERIVVNPNGVDPSRFKEMGEARRAELGFREDEVVFGFLGSFGFWHGTQQLAEAFVEVADRNKNARLLMVGDGNDRAETEDIIDRAGLSRSVVWTGRVPSEEVPALLESCDVLCSPHVPWPGGRPFHGSPTKLFEYMASGRAIVASSLGQIADVLDHESTALLVPPGDPDALADAMLRLADDPALRERLGAAAARRAVERHTWKSHAARILDSVAPA